jgi:hypothetical protein
MARAVGTPSSLKRSAIARADLCHAHALHRHRGHDSLVRVWSAGRCRRPARRDSFADRAERRLLKDGGEIDWQTVESIGRAEKMARSNRSIEQLLNFGQLPSRLKATKR